MGKDGASVKFNNNKSCIEMLRDKEEKANE